MRTRCLLTILMVPVLLVVFLSSAFAAETAKAPGVAKIIRFAYSMPSKKGLSYGWEWMGPEFEKRTNGRYKIEYYPGGTLFNISSALDSIASNVAQISNISLGQQEKRMPLSNVALLPTLDFPPTLKGRIASGRAFMQMYDKMPQLQGEWKGVKLFGMQILISDILASKKKEVYLPEHFKGYRAGGSGLRMKLVTNNGGADVMQVPPDAYMNMDKGVVDGSFITWDQIGIYKIYETAKYFCDLSFGSGGLGLIMNEDLWNGMSPEDQKIFMELWDKAHEIGWGIVWKDVEAGINGAVASGAKIHKPTTQEMAIWRKAAVPVIDQWAAEAKNVGAKAEDTKLVLEEWQKQLNAYRD